MIRRIILGVSFLLLTYNFIVVDMVLPPGAIGPYMDGIFPSKIPGAGGTWSVEDVLPDLEIKAPVRITPFPDHNNFLVLSKGGEVNLVSLEQQSKSLVLDIKDRTFKLGDSGSVGMAVHPDFWETGARASKEIFVFYKYKPNPEEWDSRGFNRISKFKWNSDQNKFDPESEEILIQQYDRSPWHDGGSMFFGPDGLLFIGFGDEGYEEFQLDSNQKIDGGFFSGILRIDVDKDSLRSHPIRRQPRSNAPPPSSWGHSFSLGYFIPNDNPWQNQDGDILEEYYALGIRSPFAMHWDKQGNQIWLADVGSDVREEINLVSKADNCQWPYMEGTQPSTTHEKPEYLIGNEKEIYFEYERDLGTCIIGGGIYTGNKFASLNGKYLFADYSKNKIMALISTGQNQAPEYEVLISDLKSQFVDLPKKAGITGIFPMPDGNIFISVMGEDYASPGKILMLSQNVLIPDPPSRLSQLGIFEDFDNFKFVDGIIPYDVNTPLWSDGALKRRWMAIPNDGTYNSPDEQIVFNKTDSWKFPEGTVFIKHFDLQTSADPDIAATPLETRFYIIGESRVAYGLTYKWNEEGTDAYLLGGGSSSYYEITDEHGDFLYSQRWDFPSRDQCSTCHNRNADYILGVKTHQLNGDYTYEDSGITINQLDYLNSLNIFQNPVRPSSAYMKSSSIEDASVDLDWRVRSYLDSNCASCHRFGGIKDVNLDFTLSEINRFPQYYNYPVESHASDPSNDIITPGDHSISEIWIRDASLESNQMPPLARNILDEVYIDSLAKWIDGIKEADLAYNHDVLVFPNPTANWITVRLNETWEFPVKIHIRTVTGRLIFQGQTDKDFEYLNLGQYPTGIYFMEFSSNERSEIRKVVVK